MNFNIFIFGFVVKICFAAVKYVPFMDDTGIQSCMPDKKYHKVDASNFMIVTQDNQLFANGTIKILENITAPLQVEIKTERSRFGQWEQGDFNRLFLNFCDAIKSEKETFYKATKDIEGCPLKKGREIQFNMVPVSDKGIDVTAVNLGPWKLKVFLWYDSKIKFGDCFLSDWEVFEE